MPYTEYMEYPYSVQSLSLNQCYQSTSPEFDANHARSSLRFLQDLCSKQNQARPNLCNQAERVLVKSCTWYGNATLRPSSTFPHPASRWRGQDGNFRIS